MAGSRIVDLTRGNSGIALAAIGQARGYRIRFYRTVHRVLGIIDPPASLFRLQRAKAAPSAVGLVVWTATETV